MPSPLPVISTRREITEAIARHIDGDDQTELRAVPTVDEARELLLVDMPPLFVMDFSDPGIDAFALQEEIRADPWLLHGGMIAVHSSRETARQLDEVEGTNLIIALAESSLEQYFSRVLAIVHDNRRLTVQRGLGADLVSNVSASYRLRNDPVEASCYVNLLCNFLFSTGRIVASQRPQFHMAVLELLLNAIEHGNCGISHEEKTAWLDSGQAIGDLIARRAATPENRDKRVLFEYSLSDDRASFHITDEGSGFNWADVVTRDTPADPLALHGRGIMMTRQACDNLSFNESGNEVRFDITFARDGELIAPRLFRDQAPIDVRNGDIIMREGEESDHLYYIAKGSFDIRIGGTLISQLSPDDIFMGEMSFLLGNRRNADVIASSAGRLIPISRKDFVLAIRKNPHYGIFLARLLAQRIDRLNRAEPTMTRSH